LYEALSFETETIGMVCDLPDGELMARGFMDRGTGG